MSTRLDPTSLRQFDCVIATFRPREQDLKPGVQTAVGFRGEFQATFRIEAEDEINGGRYVGEWAMEPVGDVAGLVMDYHWVPSCDLVDAEPVPA